MTRWGALLGGVALLLPAPPTLGAQQPPAAEPLPIEAGRAAPPGLYASDGVDVLRYDIELALPNGPGWIRGWAELTVARTPPLDAAAVALDFTGLTVDGVAVDGAPAEGWSLDQGRLRIPVPPPAGADGSPPLRIEISWRGVPDDGLVLGETVHGRPSAFVDNWPNRARFWLPSADHPSDKATLRFRVHAPAAWSVIANGRPVGDPAPTPTEVEGPPVGPRRTWVYESDVPHPTYTMVVGGAEMVVDTLGFAACGAAPASPRDDGCVAVSTWLFPESADVGRRSFRRAVEMVDFFTDLVGPFPWEKLAHVQAATRFGGMENSSAIFYSQQGIASGRDLEGTVSHETAHQWFGDAVTEAEWSHLWLSEGFATYFGALFFESADGEEAFRERMGAARSTYLASGDSLRPVIDERADLFALLNRNSYQKGGWVLHMLRRELGDEVFFEAIRTWVGRRRGDTSLTGDLRAVVEDVSGRNLEAFFTQWLDRPGHPVLAVETRPVEGGLRIDVRQVQGPYAPRFDIPVDVQVTWDGGEHRETVRMGPDDAALRVPGAPAGARVILDPDGWLLHRRIDESPSRGVPPHVG